MKKIKVKIIDVCYGYLIFIRNSIIKKIRKLHISSEVKKEIVSLASLDFMMSRKVKISVFSRYLILLIVTLFSYMFYLSTPTLYDHGTLQKDLTNKLLKEFNLNTALSANINYNILPSPNFEISNVLLNTNIDNKFNEYAQIKRMKIYVSIKNLHNQKKLKIKHVVLSEANINIDKNSYNYLNEYFRNKISNKKIQIKKSKIFFREGNTKKNIVALSTVDKANLFYDQENNINKMTIKGSIYNAQYVFTLSRDIYKKNSTDIKIKFKKLNAVIKSNFIKDHNKKNNYKGKAKISFLGSEITTSYKILDQLITFQTEKAKLNNKSISFKGKINTTPFYYNVNIILESINVRKLMENLSSLKNFLDKKILLNKNFNGKIVFNIESLKEIKFFDEATIHLKTMNEKLILNNTVISSNKIGKITFLDSNIESIDNKKIFKSKILFEISNQKKFYQKLQIPKNSRIKLFNIYFELEKDLNIDGIKINKLIFNKETKNTSLFKSKDLTDLVDINETNNLKNWIEVKKFITQMFSKINKAN